jgi:undecaprenyl-diphosphatase
MNDSIEAASPIGLAQAAVLGLIEGLTEFLPVSSTGHLLIGAKAMGLDLDDAGVQAFVIVIQAGALAAVAGMYLPSVAMMLRGLIGRSAEGLRLAGLLLLAFIPAAIVGLLFEARIELFLADPRQRPVAWALAVGGVAMIAYEYWRKRAVARGDAGPEPALIHLAVDSRKALLIGLAQCLALLPGTSRSMVTILAGVVVGLPPRQAAEFSFLLALPTLGGATVYKLFQEGDRLMTATGAGGLAVGAIVSCVVAAASVKFLIHYLNRHGLALFGWYRLVVAATVLLYW